MSIEAFTQEQQSQKQSEALDLALQKMVDDGGLPYAVAAIGTKSAALWSGAAGQHAKDTPASEDTIFRIVSMTKAIGSTAALILADRGLLDWDMPVDEVLPEFGDLTVIDQGSHGRVLRPARTKATLRHLATHTSGLAYEFWDGDIGRWLADTGTPSIVSGQRAALAYPLAFDPGARWQYGGGVDWLGMVIAAIDGRPIDRFCAEEIFRPLGMTSTTFELAPDDRHRLGFVAARTQDGHLGESVLNLDPPANPEFYGMGHALYSTAADYLRFLRMWLGNGALDGVRILRETTAADALRNQIGDLRIIPRSTAFPAAVADLDPMPGVELSHSLLAARTEQAVTGRRGVGSQFWGGVLNTHFWFDPTNDLAGVLMTQVVPFLDPLVMKNLAEFERLSYSLLQAQIERERD